MTEKVILLEGVDPVELYGAGNSNIEKISAKFPKLKIIARGSSVKVMGEASEIGRFEQKLTDLIDYYGRYGHLSGEVIDQVYDGGMPKRDETADKDAIVFGNNGVIVRARTVNQQKLVQLYEHNDLLFAVGPAGSGKTYTAIALAVRALKNKEVKRIILTRPAVEAGEKLGFLPGDLAEKVNPYLRPLHDALLDMLGPQKMASLQETGIIEVAPLAFMRGRTLNDAFIILDEAQNTTREQMKMFLTRLGFGSRAAITGDITQIDLPAQGEDSASRSGLVHALHVLKGVKGVAFRHFTSADVVRHPLVGRIVQAYDDYEKLPSSHQ